MFRFNKTGSGNKVLLYAIFIIAHGSTSFICLYEFSTTMLLPLKIT